MELSQTENQVQGIAHLCDDKFGIALYDISGSITDGTMIINGTPKQASEGGILGETTIIAELKQDGSLASRWETTIGSAGTVRLYPHNYEEKFSKTAEPEQIYNKIVPIGSVRLFKKDVNALFNIIEKDFSEGRLIVTYMQRSNEVTRFATDFVSNLDDIEELRSLKIFIQEPEAPGINKMVTVDFFERDSSSVRVSGINESWVVGKAESINKEIANYQNKVVTNYRRCGLRKPN